MLLVGKALGAGGCGVGVDAVAAAVDRRCGDVDQLLGEGIELAGFDHHFLDAGPGSLENGGLVGERSPEVIYEVRFARGADVVEDCFDAGIGCDFFVSPKLYGSHGGDLSGGK